MQMLLYQIISAFFEDDCADELTLDPVFNAIFERNSLASQPALSRFFNSMNENTFILFDDINKSLKDIIYTIKCPEHMLLDLNSTHADKFMEPCQILRFYCVRSKMENFIKEDKSGFNFATAGSHSKAVNVKQMRIKMLAYNLFNWLRRLVFPANMRK